MNERRYRAWGVIPAAGASARMGQPKLLLPWDGRPMLAATVARWRAAAVDGVLVVLRDDCEVALRSAAAEALVVLARAPVDMKASIRAGLAEIARRFDPAPHDAWLVAPADMPALDPRAIRAVLAAYDPSAPTIVAATYAGRRGHPVLFPWSLAAAVGELGEDEGLDALLRREPVRAACLDDIAAPSDIDTPDDYRAALARLAAGE